MSEKAYDGCFTATEVAKKLDLSTKKFNNILKQERFQFKKLGCWKVNHALEDLDLVQYRSFTIERSNGEIEDKEVMVFTEKGVEYVMDIFNNVIIE